MPESARLNPPSRPTSRFGRFMEDSSFLRHYLWKYRLQVGFGLLTLVAVDLLEILPPIYLKEAIDNVTGRGPRGTLVRLAAFYFGVAVLQGLCRYGWRMLLVRTSLFAGRDLRARFVHHLYGLSTSFFDRRPVGELMSLATGDVEAVRMAIGMGLLFFADAVFYFLTVPVAMFLISPRLTLLAFLPLPIIPWLVIRHQRAVQRRFEKVQAASADLSAIAQESLTGVRVLKGFAREDAQIARFRAKGEEYARLHLSLARVQTAFGPSLDFTMSLGMVLLLFVGGRLMIGPSAAGAAITLGTFVAFQRYIQKMVWPMAAIGMSISLYQRAVASSNRLKEVHSTASDTPEPVNPRLPELVRGRTAGRIEFRDLSFAFPGADRQALRGIRLTIEPGERVAFVGAVGAGKSALLSLLPRLYPVSRGMLLVDGVDVNDWPLAELRRQVGFVGQEAFLFSETVTENVAFGLAQWATGGSGGFDRSGLLSPQAIEEAASLASVHEDVLGLSGAYQTRLGERGVNLSGGQKQRLTIARAIAKQPPILVLDDALAAVDVQTEKRILKGLRDRPGRNTEIVAAHRISTIQDADRIVVLEGGAIAQDGTHESLIAQRSGLYRKFYEQQRLQEDLEDYAQRLGEEEEADGLRT